MFTKPAGSHIPVLVEYVLKTDKPVVELGSGWYSTPLLSWLCFDRGLDFSSYESDMSWVIGLDGMTLHVNSYDDAPLERELGIVFIDHAPAERRIVDIKRVKDNADYVIVHDTEPSEESAYHYSEIYDLFKYKKVYDKHLPHTTVLSNKIPL